MRFIAISNYLRVLIFAILLSFAEIAEINTRENKYVSMSVGKIDYSAYCAHRHGDPLIAQALVRTPTCPMESIS